MNTSLRIGISGTRGIPNRYGGFEQCAEYLALGLADKGHSVSVYNAHSHEYKDATWKGVNIIHCKDPEEKLGTFGQFIYDYNCIMDARKRKFDILLHLGYTSDSVWHKIWPRESMNIVNMDGLEWKRTKYNKYVQRFLKYAEKLAAKNADGLVADSIGIQQHLKDTYNKSSVFIPYGAEIFEAPDKEVLRKYNLLPLGYNLLIARMEPENNIETIIKGALDEMADKPLVIIGKTDNSFGTYLSDTYGSRKGIRFVGGVYDTTIINNLRYYSLLYFHGHSVGGTNPSLLEAMACSALIVAHDNVFNNSVLGDDAYYFSKEADISGIINSITNKYLHDDKLQNNCDKIRTTYNWPHIVAEYEKVFIDAVSSR